MTQSRFSQLQVKLIQLLFKPLLRFGINPSIQSTAMWSMLESFSSPFFSLLLIPILTHSLGLEKYGLYVMVLAFVGLFSFTGLGMNTSITYYLAVNHQTSNAKNIAERLGTALSVTLLGTIIFSLTFLLAFTLFEAALQKSYPQLIAQQSLIYAALLLLIFTQCDMVISAALKGLQQFKASSKLEFLIRFVGFVAVALVATILKNVTVIIIFAVIIAFFSMMLRFKVLSKVVDIRLIDIKLDRQYAGEFFHFGKWMTLQNISGAIFGSLDKIMLGLLFSTTVVGTYNIIISITQLSHYVLASASSFILPKISASTASIKILRKSYYKSLVVSALVTLLMMLVLTLLYPFIKGHFNLVNIKYEYFILLISYGVLAICVPPYYFALGFGKVKLLSNINTISAVVGIVAIMLLINKYEILGAVLSRAVYTIAVTLTFFVPPLLFKNNLENSHEHIKLLKTK